MMQSGIMPRIVYIQNVETGMAVSIQGARTDQSTNLVMWPFNGSPYQLWRLEGTRIRSMHCSHVMDLAGPSNEGSHVIIYPENSGVNQQWYIQSNGTIQNGTGLVLDVQSGSRNPDAHLIGWRYNGGANQMFRVVDYSFGPQPPWGWSPNIQPSYPPPPYTPSYEMRTVYIQCTETDLVLDIKDGSRSSGAHVIMWPFKASTNQLWRITGNTIRSMHSRHVLDLAGPSTEGSKIIVWEENGGNNQKWHIESDGTIRNGTGLVMDVQGGSRHKGAHVIGWRRTGRSNQKFRVVMHQ